MNRRSFMGAALAIAAPARAATHLDRTRVSAITDEIARSPAASIEFAQQYGLKWLSLRDVPAEAGLKRTSYHKLEGAELQQAALAFKDAGVQIALLDTPFLKFGLPGTQPIRRRPEEPADRDKRQVREQAQFETRLDDLRQGIRASHAFECPRLRIFTFSRVAEPESIFPRISEVIGEMALIAEKDGVKLLIENEASQNAGTSAETAKLLKLLPGNVGINWDSLNALPLGEKAFPDGYESVPKDKMWNVHVKGKSLLDYPERLNWVAIFQALEKDGFSGWLELETHIFGPQQVPSSHASMKELIRLLSSRT